MLFCDEQERGPYLPVRQILRTIVSVLDCRDRSSAELFNGRMTDSAASTPKEHAETCAQPGWPFLKTALVSSHEYLGA